MTPFLSRVRELADRPWLFQGEVPKAFWRALFAEMRLKKGAVLVSDSDTARARFFWLEDEEVQDLVVDWAGDRVERRAHGWKRGTRKLYGGGWNAWGIFFAVLKEAA